MTANVPAVNVNRQVYFDGQLTIDQCRIYDAVSGSCIHDVVATTVSLRVGTRTTATLEYNSGTIEHVEVVAAPKHTTPTAPTVTKFMPNDKGKKVHVNDPALVPPFNGTIHYVPLPDSSGRQLMEVMDDGSGLLWTVNVKNVELLNKVFNRTLKRRTSIIGPVPQNLTPRFKCSECQDTGQVTLFNSVEPCPLGCVTK